jgi:ribosomal protein S18 acetylase RimI-like enzyme
MSEIEKWFDVDGAFFWRLFVLNKYRNQGIGEKLIEYGLQSIDKKSYKKAYVVIETNNTSSQRLFESFGFKKQKIISFFRFFSIKKQKEISF